MNKSFALISIASMTILLTGCGTSDNSTLTSESDEVFSEICIEMGNQPYRSDLYAIFTNESIENWTSGISAKDSSTVRDVVQPVVDSAFNVSLSESASGMVSLDGLQHNDLVRFPELSRLQLECSKLGLPVTLPAKYNSHDE